jgi:hypothetical protein
MRYRFLKYAEEEVQNFRIFLAEMATKDLTQHNEPEFINVADFESLVADICDCILLFLESPGAIAELGYFANSETAIKKLLVVNDVEKQGDSFINLGPINKIDKESVFQSTIWLDFKQPDFNKVKERLNDRLRTERQKRFKPAPFAELKVPEKLFVVFQILYIFRALTLPGALYCLNTIFGEINEKEVKYLLSILIAAEYVGRRGDDFEFFVPTSDVEPFLVFKHYDVADLVAYTTAYFSDHHPETFEILSEVAR